MMGRVSLEVSWRDYKRGSSLFICFFLGVVCSIFPSSFLPSILLLYFFVVVVLSLCLSLVPSFLYLLISAFVALSSLIICSFHVLSLLLSLCLSLKLCLVPSFLSFFISVFLSFLLFMSFFLSFVLSFFDCSIYLVCYLGCLFILSSLCLFICVFPLSLFLLSFLLSIPEPNPSKPTKTEPKTNKLRKHNTIPIGFCRRMNYKSMFAATLPGSSICYRGWAALLLLLHFLTIGTTVCHKGVQVK